MVYVAQDGKAVQRPVKVLASQDDQAAVSGVEPGDKVIVDGRQNLRPDAPITERQPEQAKGGKGGKSAKGEQPAKAAP